MHRRTFITATAAGAATIPAIAARAQQRPASSAPPPSGPFKLAYAPHFGMFSAIAGDDPVAQLEFAADHGFRAWEDNGMSGRPIDEQQRIADAMQRLGIRMGVFVLNPSSAWGPTFARNDAGDRSAFVDACKASIDIAKRVHAKWMTVVCGTREQRLDLGYQTASAIDQLRAGAEVLEPHGLVMVLEPLNPRDHPNMLLAEMAHGFEICRAVNSPSCKILCDIYHQQITEGNLIPNIDRCWDEIAYFQAGDNPGRNEPTTGEIHYQNVFRHIHTRGFTGIIGMEHGNSKGGADGARSVIDAYRWADGFTV